MKNVAEEIELAIFDKPMNRDHYNCNSPMPFWRLNRR